MSPVIHTFLIHTEVTAEMKDILEDKELLASLAIEKLRSGIYTSEFQNNEGN